MTNNMGGANENSNNDVLQGDKQQAILLPLLQAAEDSKSSNISVIRSIVMKALAEPAIFCGYDQLKAVLHTALSSNGAEGEKLGRTLDLFSYGTFLQYQGNPTLYLDLTGAQLHKLKQLSVLSVVQQACTDGFKSNGGALGLAMIPYAKFETELQMTTTTESNPRQVEDVLVSCLYQGVLHGKLCQQSRSIHLSPHHPILPRDVPPTQIATLIQQVRAVQDSIASATGTLQAQKQAAMEDIAATNVFWQQVEERKKKNENSNVLRWDVGDQFGAEGGGSTRRQKRGRATASADPAAVFARYQA